MAPIEPTAGDLERFVQEAAQETPKTSTETPAQTPGEEGGTTPAEENQLETSEEQPAEETPAEEAGAEDPQWLVKWYDDTFGAKNREKFKTSFDMMAAFREMERRLGQRDADAELGRKLRGREADIEQVLDRAKPVDQGPPEYDPAWQFQLQRDTEGKLVAAHGAPADLPQKWERYHRWRDQQLDRLLRDPEGFLGSTLAKTAESLKGELAQVTEAKTAEHRETLEIQAWADRNKAQLYANAADPAGGLTPLGKRVAQLEREMAAAGMPEATKRLEWALKMARSEQPAPKRTKTPSSQAVHQPGVKSTPAAPKSVDELACELIDKGVPLSRAVVQAQRAVAARQE